MSGATRNTREPRLRTLPEWLPAATARLLEPRRTFSSGFEALDHALGGGFRAGQAITVGGAAGKGKSLLVLNLAWRLSPRVPVVLLDFENGDERLAERLHALAGCRPGEGDAVARARFRLRRDRLFLIDPDTIRDAHDLEGACADLRLDHSAGPCVLIVDSLHKLPPLAVDRRSAVDDWCRTIEKLRHAYRLTIISTAEIARNAGGDDPFKESSEVKYTHDVATVITGDPEKRRGALKFVKHRDTAPPASLSFRIDYPRIVLTLADSPRACDAVEEVADRLLGVFRGGSIPLSGSEAIRSAHVNTGLGHRAIRRLLDAGSILKEGRKFVAIPTTTAGTAGRCPAANPCAAVPAGPFVGPAGSSQEHGPENGETARAKLARSASEASNHEHRASRDEGAERPRSFLVTPTGEVAYA